MVGKSSATALAALCIASIPFGSSSQPLSNKAATVLAGSYMHGAEQIRLLKKTRCAYLVQSPYPTYQQLLQTDVLIAFPEAERERIGRATDAYLTSHEAENQARIDSQIQKLTSQYDEKTACGFMAGLYVGMFETYKQEWQNMKQSMAPTSK